MLSSTLLEKRGSELEERDRDKSISTELLLVTMEVTPLVINGVLKIPIDLESLQYILHVL
jgi:hypothetical protein